LPPLFEELQQRADPGKLHPLDDELVFRAAGIGREAAGADHLHAVFGLDRKAQRRAAPADAVEHRVRILEREVAMARAVPLEAGDFAADAHIGVVLLDRALQRGRQLAHRIFRKVRAKLGRGHSGCERGSCHRPL
jgi:hypothetical protein